MQPVKCKPILTSLISPNPLQAKKKHTHKKCIIKLLIGNMVVVVHSVPSYQIATRVAKFVYKKSAFSLQLWLSAKAVCDLCIKHIAF